MAQEANPRIRAALLSAGLSVEDAAQKLEIDPHTIREWMKGRDPYLRNKGRFAAIVNRDPAWLFPTEAGKEQEGDDLVAMYTHRSDLPAETWRTLLRSASERVDLLAYAMLFFIEMNPDLHHMLIDKASTGCAVRIALVDPDSDVAAQRDHEEALALGLVARIRTAKRYLEPLTDHDGIELREHRAPMYCSVFRFDQDMLVTPHLYRTPGYLAPLLRLTRAGAGGTFDAYAGHFERIWDDSTPMEVGHATG